VAYDYNTSSLKLASNGRGSYEIGVVYIKPSPKTISKKVYFVCPRY
jgi:hypothetical protein